MILNSAIRTACLKLLGVPSSRALQQGSQGSKAPPSPNKEQKADGNIGPANRHKLVGNSGAQRFASANNFDSPESTISPETITGGES